MTNGKERRRKRGRRLGTVDSEDLELQKTRGSLPDSRPRKKVSAAAGRKYCCGKCFLVDDEDGGGGRVEEGRGLEVREVRRG